MAFRSHPIAQTPAAPSPAAFHPFPALPSEIRSKIWEASLIPRLIKCKREGSKNIFSGPSMPVALLSVCRESRENAFLYGEYILVPSSPGPALYFSPAIDYLWIEAGWKPLVPTEPVFFIQLFEGQPLERNHDFTKSLTKEIMGLRNVMTGPNWSEARSMPTVTFSDFPHLERILVAADEYSVGNQSKVSRDTVYDLKMHYHDSNKDREDGQKAAVPEIAIGCLGWVGEEKSKLHHMFEDNRQLLHIFTTDSAMRDHQQRVREEAFMFTQKKRNVSQARDGLIEKLQRAQELSEKNKKMASNTYSGSSKEVDEVEELQKMVLKISPSPSRMDRSPEYEMRDSQMDRNELPPYAAPRSGGCSL
ncbi:hypothetical protein HYALB_00000461 [Hymenoscyphus albidus]|uniref:2EXR domain-containing protein n=1 Tax=Hymenoscyphus albidus TaxID=595503 RepID=A0A9N9LLQ4_9HELO|nr:hypothetical protein HYALB_00000461 [Hymenoscyphus albidus]